MKAIAKVTAIEAFRARKGIGSAGLTTGPGDAVICERKRYEIRLLKDNLFMIGSYIRRSVFFKDINCRVLKINAP